MALKVRLEPFDRVPANGWNRRSAGILAWRREGLKCADSGRSYERERTTEFDPRTTEFDPKPPSTWSAAFVPLVN